MAGTRITTQPLTENIMANYMQIRINETFHGNRFDTMAGDVKTFRFNCPASQQPHSNVLLARAGKPIISGGAVIPPSAYTVLFDGEK
jgi:hypothetical protein